MTSISNNPTFIAAQAQSLTTHSAMEDEKSTSAAKNSNFDKSIQNSKKAAKTRRSVADEAVKAAKKGVAGLAAGLGVSIAAAIAIIVCAVLAAAVACLTGGAALALIGVALAVAVAGGVGGSAAGDAAGKKNLDQKAKGDHDASKLDASAAEQEQSVDDWDDLEGMANDNFDQALADRRQREEYLAKHGVHTVNA